MKGYMLVISSPMAATEAIAFTRLKNARNYISYWYLSDDATEILLETGKYLTDNNIMYKFYKQDIDPKVGE